MKRLIALITVVVGLALASPATAAISIGYCAASLRGETGQAPDDDIRAAWNALQGYPWYYNIVSSEDNPYGWASPSPNLTVNNGWRFHRANGSIVYANFRCYWGTDGIYHDGAY